MGFNRKQRVGWDVVPANDRGGYAVQRTANGASECVGRDRFWARFPQHVGQPFTLAEAQAVVENERRLEDE